ncbi:hypothetical protein [Mucilaginibacter sp.]|uniref:hypothetical protein n=1 Tax=Mucilaginibacter sp. TaxID=1882438 RepID=UPI0025FA09C7|nr:hypothetical protein [Mucilaginibacter sp.]
MQNEQFNDRNLFSVHIRLHKINDPLMILNNFFSDDWLPGHLERLKKWRQYVLAGDYYKDAKGSPSGLLYFHELNICLIEAMHSYYEKGIAAEVLATKVQLEEEQKNWRDFPVLLSDAELLSPLLVIEDFFRDYDHHQYISMLYEWLEYGLSSSPAAEFIQTGSFITVYENLQKLYCAAWLIFQRSTEKPWLKV